MCASDGFTYRHECEMRRAACEINLDIHIKFYGKCEDELDNNIESHSLLTLNYAQGNALQSVDSCGSIKCEPGLSCVKDKNGQPKCVCLFQCSSQNNSQLICGSDGIFYANDCYFQEASCKLRKKLLKEPLENCKQSIDAVSHCSTSAYGCCPDKVTPSQGPKNAGCFNVCDCNRLGSFSLNCDPLTKQCSCKPGVGGLKCDRCESGFWGLYKISSGVNGCTRKYTLLIRKRVNDLHVCISACACNQYGAMRDDCEQTTGRCVCKKGAFGMKCEKCPKGQILTPNGCDTQPNSLTRFKTCDDIKCQFGAACKQELLDARCVCNFDCDNYDLTPVCGSDNNTYGSFCQLQLFSCRYQKEILLTKNGSCGNFNSTLFSITSNIQSTAPQEDPKSDVNLTSLKMQDTNEIISSKYKSNNSFEVPNFTGYSYLRLAPLKAKHRFSINLEVTAYSENGIILYNGQSGSNKGDWIAIILKNGHLEFSYNLGSGKLTLKSERKVILYKPFKLSAKRYNQDGLLLIEGQKPVIGKAKGSMKSLDLNESLYLGWYDGQSERVKKSLATDLGFKGCINKMTIDKKKYNLKYPESADILEEFNILDCRSDACLSSPCLNGATCLYNHHSNNFTCLCLNGYFGERCQIKVNQSSNSYLCSQGSNCFTFASKSNQYKCECSAKHTGQFFDDLQTEMKTHFVIELNGSSYIQLNLPNSIIHAFDIEIWFYSRSLNGLLIYASQERLQLNDYLSLIIVDGFIEYQYDLGSGPAVIR